MSVFTTLLLILASFILGLKVLQLIKTGWTTWEVYLVSPGVGLVLIGEASWLYAMVVGALPQTPWLFALILALIVFLMTRYKKAGEKTSVRQWTPATLVLFGLIVGYILWVLGTKVLHPDVNGAMMIGPPMLYGDTPVHVAYTSKLAYGTFPPDQPIFAAAPLTYPYMSHLVNALFVKSGMQMRLALFLPQAMFSLAFVALLLRLWRRFLSDTGLVAAGMTFFLGFGTGFVNALAASFRGESFQAFTNRVGDLTHNDTFGMHLANVLTGVILPGRTIIPGLVIGLFMSDLVLAWQKLTIKKAVFIGYLLGILPLWHTHTAIFMVIALVWWVVSLSRDTWKKRVLYIAVILTVAAVVSLPRVWPVLAHIGDTSFMQFISGWQLGGANPVWFWFQNSLLLLPLAAIGTWLLPKQVRLFMVPAWIMFVALNVISFQPLAWDNIKLLTWVILFWAIAVGFVFETLFKKGLVIRLVAIGIVLISSLSGIMSLTIPFSQEFVLYDKTDQEVAEWARLHTQSNSVFLTDLWHNHPISNLSGRSVYMGYQGTLWTYGIDYGKREAIVNRVLAGEYTAARMETKTPINYLVLTGSGFADVPYQTVYSNPKYTVFQVR